MLSSADGGAKPSASSGARRSWIPCPGAARILERCWHAWGGTVDAQRYFRRAIEIDPDDVFAHLQLGSLLLTQDKAKLAIAEFNQALALAPRNPDAHRAMAVGLIELGRLDEAELILRRGLRDVDVAKSGTLHLTLAQLLARQGENASDNKLIEEALKEVGLALTRQPRSCAALFQRGLIRAKLGDLRGALQSFQQVLALDRHHLQAELNRQQVAALLRQERKPTGASRVASVFLCVVLLAHLGALWWLFIASDRVSATVFAALLPLLLGLLVVACLLPWLSRLKLTGLEAELSVPKAKDTLASGPEGALRFGDETPKSL
ncbi:tetratricopeptide repeat protein [Roseateles sp. UC29_93]|uniref:tetratricopeptide repeat protein n=1 Tax=Roseateles sp. UC29_93 TaxID=3350177 RepID=UPI003672DCFB